MLYEAQTGGSDELTARLTGSGTSHSLIVACMGWLVGCFLPSRGCLARTRAQGRCSSDFLSSSHSHLSRLDSSRVAGLSCLGNRVTTTTGTAPFGLSNNVSHSPRAPTYDSPSTVGMSGCLFSPLSCFSSSSLRPGLPLPVRSPARHAGIQVPAYRVLQGSYGM